MMQLEDYFNFLTPNDIRLKGTRIGIETILYDYIYHAKWVGGIKYKMNVGWASAVSSAERLKHETQRPHGLRYR
ncbi:MAG: hypothetical protein EWV75_09435 [Microcystis wesenbergii Mw_QC_S_20081001_S30D]|jgi:hypothetical protein|uniref:Uncharacterized protein n=2 Tax=Microcystis TaxID=1125 RepID=A0A552JP70_9CHRO|nr:hypothetical protein [Microcystis aeruginosa]TRT53674.1 MAG: hypothetical protein EWV85_13835 [Microcystis aeruginosa Ma_QC_C_20070703_M131]TRU97274.1 MAG: hypothetical protein EWV75_09435 [Microcystis wesenbergii Mw_QC_S_20081001_S30D]TRU99617.1 MAG: hypothetical protein EWV74_13750 [Microcystis wesenbergii Mw_QC_S_20081001_S30]TRV05272.1 MAG: hypothetical protein EWV73_00950 [Microcystis wesenbergii Mw_QC_B_20070930_S4D]TRV14503.1 MAG: hypothetical protein EWV89_09310 [Microcystis wesenbe